MRTYYCLFPSLLPWGIVTGPGTWYFIFLKCGGGRVNGVINYKSHLWGKVPGMCEILTSGLPSGWTSRTHEKPRVCFNLTLPPSPLWGQRRERGGGECQSEDVGLGPHRGLKTYRNHLEHCLPGVWSDNEPGLDSKWVYKCIFSH
jgi:hypothetical protein